MGLLDELKRALGLDGEDQPPPVDSGPSLVGPRPTLDPRRWEGSWNPPEVIDARANEALNPTHDLMVPPPPEKYNAVYKDAGGEQQTARDSDAARILSDASQMLQDRPGRAGGRVRGLTHASGAARASESAKAEPPEKAGPDTGKADLLAAMSKVAKPPEDAAEVPAPAEGQHPTVRGDAGPPPPVPPPESGGMLGSLTKMVMGSSDPRVDRLKAALERSAHMKRLAGHISGMGIGADLAEGVRVHGDQGKGLRDRADDEVRAELMPTEFEQKNTRFDTEQQRAGQEMRLRDAGEGRAQQGELRAASGEQRASAEELRKGETFKTQQGYTDAKSQTSANARASIESLYPAAWKRIPEEIRNNFSAKDVERIFGEVSQKDFANKLGGGGGSVMDRFEERQVQDYNKGRVSDRSISAVNNLMGRLSDKAPIQGFDAAKGWAQASKIPLLGGLLSGAGNSAVRGTEMEGIAQDAMAIMQQISLDTSGKVLNESEIRNIERRLGLATGQGEEAFRRAMKREFDAIQAKADRDFESLSPGARQKVEARGLRPRFKAVAGDYAPKENTPLGERGKDFHLWPTADEERKSQERRNSPDFVF